MFPAPVGMNRSGFMLEFSERNVPRACGDEPPVGLTIPGCVGMFPAPVGMNRKKMILDIVLINVPRACGDEPPLIFVTIFRPTCSPRLWG